MSESKLLIDGECTYKNGELVKTPDGDYYNCTLNQTDLVANKNKFYIMQLVKYNNLYYHFIRYGRICEVGHSTHNQYQTEHEAILLFTKQFKAKTGNNWENRNTFIKKMTNIS